MARRFAVLMCVAGVLWAAPASAQAAGGGSTGIGVRAFGHLEWQSMAAKDTFEAITGKTRLGGFGAGVEVQQVWRRLFARVSLSRMSKTGERVFVFENEVFPLGIPLELTLTPIEVSAGWRFAPSGARGIVPYVGGGALFMKFKQSSDGDDPGERVNETYNGFQLFGGIEIPVWRYLSAGAEIGWRKANVPDPDGTLAAFGEKDLGGLTMRVMVSIGK